MTVEFIEDKFIRRTAEEGKRLHKIGTLEYYSEAVDLIDSPYEYEEVDDPDYVAADSDSDSEE